MMLLQTDDNCRVVGFLLYPPAAGDRGGVADLISTIKLSKLPIICICNDKYSQKLRSLRNHVSAQDIAFGIVDHAWLHLICMIVAGNNLINFINYL